MMTCTSRCSALSRGMFGRPCVWASKA
jgi:hypothetical protein